MHTPKTNNEPNAVHTQAPQAKSGGNTPFFQPKLTVNQPGDEYEREADAVADQVMRMTDAQSLGGSQGEGNPASKPLLQRKPLALTPFFSPAAKNLQRKCAECEKEDEGVQRKETSDGTVGGQSAPSIVSDVLSSGSGQPMEGGTRQFMESRFGQDFSQVRIHVGERAAESAEAIQAKAYTSGRDIVFGKGEYQPGSDSGKKLLAHELAHVGQQGGEGGMSPIQRSGSGAALGGAIGGLLGAGLGIGIGAAVGGVAGAITGGIIGGLAGTLTGMVVGDSESSDERNLNSREEQELRRVFGSSLNYSDIKISFNAPIMTLGNYARTPHNTVYFPAREAAAAAAQTNHYFAFLVHEVTHVWQHQHGVPVLEKLGHAIRGESAYAYGGEAGLEQARREGRHFGDFNTEQQGDICRDYYRILTGDLSRNRELYEYFIREVQSGEIIRRQPEPSGVANDYPL